jgi:hypothetical protein
LQESIGFYVGETGLDFFWFNLAAERGDFTTNHAYNETDPVWTKKRLKRITATVKPFVALPNNLAST